MENRDILSVKYVSILLLFIALAPSIRAQETVTISGKVTSSDDNSPLIGANILLKGQNRNGHPIATMTDKNGEYHLKIPNLKGQLVFTYLGFEKKTVKINGRTTINVKLQRRVVQQDRVVVVGYGKQQAANISGSMTNVPAKSFKQQPVTTLSGALQGKAAGLRVQRTSGKPGSGFSIRIRGSNSINGSNNPLMVVDGIQGGSVSDPHNIASVEVLKDAAATAIYGSKGANGVILITTKNGLSGKPVVNFRGSVGFQTVEKKLDLLNGPQFARTVNAQRKATGSNPAFSHQQIAKLERTGGTNWQDLALRDGAPVQQYHLSVSRGNKNGVSYFVAGRYLKNEGIVRDQGYRKYGLRANIDYNYSEKLNFSLNVHGTRSVRDGNAMNIINTIRMDPTLPPLKDEDGNYTLTSRFAGRSVNPYIKMLKSRKLNVGTRLDSRATVQYNFTDALSLHILGSLIYRNSNNNSYASIILNNRGSAHIRNNHGLHLQNTNRLTYDKQFNEDNELLFDLIFEQQFSRSQNHSVNGYDFPTDATGYKKISLASTLTASSSYHTTKLMSYIGRVHYVWKDRYLLTATARVDGSSKFRKGDQYGIFPSGSVGWKIANEKFMENLDFINQFKLRASYGVTGNQGIAALATRAKLVTGSGVSYPINDSGHRQTGVAPTNQLPNPDLTWETTKQADIGIDMGFLNSRVNFTADVYRKETNNLLLRVPLPIFTGANFVMRNLGKVQNKGLEMSLRLNPIRSDNLSLTTNFNISFNRNKVISLGERNQILIGPHNGALGGTYPLVIQEGQPMGLFRGYVFDGVYQKDQASEAAKYGKQPGDAIYKDLNNDGKINGSDIKTIGKAQPDFIYGFNATLQYQNFDLNIVITGSYGGEIYNLTHGQLFGISGTTLDPVTADVLNRWTPDNPSNKIPGFTTSSQSYLASSQWIEDGSYLKINNLALGYTLPKTFLNKVSVRSLKVFVSAQNLATFTKFGGYDPQLQSHGNNTLYRGINYAFSSYPLARTITFGVNIKF